ncbi:MAG TPA: phage tail protein [Pyrinomonadaceae bacterium]|nr:phage tail protein [Pyrinomonadaceae bacterium]
MDGKQCVKVVMVVTEREFNVQVMETATQWAGLRQRLEFGAEGLSLFVNPSFESWLITENWQSGAGDIVVDQHGQVYWTELEVNSQNERTWKLRRRTGCEIETLVTFSGCATIEPRKLWLSDDSLWILDQHLEDEKKATRSGRLLALSRENFQILHEFNVSEVIDLDLDRKSFFYTLVQDQKTWEICRRSISTPGKKECLRPEDLQPALKWIQPEALAVGPDGLVYVLDPKLGGFIRVDLDKREQTFLRVTEAGTLEGTRPRVMEIDKRGVIFLVSTDKKTDADGLFMFDKDGSFLGTVELPSLSSLDKEQVRKRGLFFVDVLDDPEIKRIDGIGFDSSGGVYLATDKGLARFDLATNPVGQDGVFYSRTLDNGEFESAWHRLALKGSIPPKSCVEVFYFTSDNQNLKAAHDATLASNASAQEKAAAIENRIIWRQKQVFIGADFEEPDKNSKTKQEVAPDFLFDPNKGRFLWFKLRLVTFDHRTRPTINSVRIDYPRLSYVRYLPPVYREDPVGAAFLERFLSMFETILGGLDQEIDELFRYFDFSLTPEEFLPWLASWVNLSFDDDLPKDRVRRFIQKSASLFNRKGTPEALIEFLEIYTGRPVFLTEHTRGLKPLVLGSADFKLGRGAVLLAPGPKGMSVGDTTVVGYSAIRDRISDADEPFLSAARRFTVVIDMDSDDFQKLEGTLQRIVDEQKPAHTSCRLRSTGAQETVGNAMLGVSGTVRDTQPYRIGVTRLGVGSAMAEDQRVLRLERGAWVGSSKRL